MKRQNPSYLKADAQDIIEATAWGKKKIKTVQDQFTTLKKKELHPLVFLLNSNYSVLHHILVQEHLNLYGDFTGFPSWDRLYELS